MAHLSPLNNSKLPDFSYMLRVGQIRCIQAAHETGELRNPDGLVGKLLSPWQRWSCFWRGRLLLSRLRSDPFYYYIAARTIYYDEVFVEALANGFQYIINIGCGSDTRSYRYVHLMTENTVGVVECDQRGAIEAKQDIASRRLPYARVEHLVLDLNEPPWPNLAAWLHARGKPRVLVLMEGVSPYINQDSFGDFLQMLSTQLAPGSRVAYDFKVQGKDDQFGVSTQTQRPFRLSTMEHEVAAYHQALGYQLRHLETSAALSRRLLPSLAKIGALQAFQKDCLVQLNVRS